MTEPSGEPGPRVYGEPMMPVPRLGRGEGVVPTRWVAKVVCLSVGTTLVMVQFLAWLFWQREPILVFLTLGAWLMGMPVSLTLDEKRHRS